MDIYSLDQVFQLSLDKNEFVQLYSVKLLGLGVFQILSGYWFRQLQTCMYYGTGSASFV